MWFIYALADAGKELGVIFCRIVGLVEDPSIILPTLYIVSAFPKFVTIIKDHDITAIAFIFNGPAFIFPFADYGIIEAIASLK